MSVGLSGNLVDFGIADVFQLIGQQRKTGLLELRTRGAEATLVFDGGSVVSALPAGDGDVDALSDKLVRCGLLRRAQAQELSAAARASAGPPAWLAVERGWLAAEELATIEDLLTRDTVFEVLRWSSGRFDFRAREVDHQRDPGSLLGAEQILMDGLRMLDEWHSFADRVPDDAIVYQRAGRFEAFAQRAGGRSEQELAQAERLFSRIDGRVSARRAIDLARLGTFDGTRLLAAFADAGLIERSRGARLARVRRPSLRERLNALRRSATTLAPLVVLALVASQASPGGAPTPTEASFPIDRAGLEAVESAWQIQRVRRAADTYRLATGRWPDSLEALVSSGLLSKDALATRGGRPYHAQRRREGLLVLAPER